MTEFVYFSQYVFLSANSKSQRSSRCFILHLSTFEGDVAYGAVELFLWYLPYAAGVLPRRQKSVALSLVPLHVAGAAADAAIAHALPALSSPLKQNKKYNIKI